ncbi:nuclear factor 7, brain-like [Leptodactylus fuscus]|uniref:nuclear factor 7, brain-like n=1 Tax=Leptodactylus fuscus TaxID=238119 RepID=UPI003F4E90F9
MASANLRDEVSCSICLHIYTDPVTLRCGHNFCQECIDRVLDSQRGSRVYKCPDCRKEFNKRPSLYRNVTLRSIAKHFQPTRGQLGKAMCTYCLHWPVPAVMSCVLCEASLCGRHLEVHNKSPEHVLIDPAASFKNRKCSTHKKVMEYYCSEDEMCICVYCRVDGDHSGHLIQSLDEASEMKKKKLTKVLNNLTSKKKEVDKEIQNLHGHLKTEKWKTAKIKGKVSALFIDIRRQMEDLENKVLSEISGWEEQASALTLDVMKQLEIKKNHLSKTISQIEEICKMTDPLLVLQDLKCEDHVHYSKTDDGSLYKQKTKETGYLDGDQIKKTIHDQLCDVIAHVNGWLFLPDLIDLSLDVNTAANNLYISEDLKTALLSYTVHNRPLCPDRFPQNEVLSTQSFSSGQHYWQVATSKWGNWRLGVSYPCRNGIGGVSWALWKNHKQCLAVNESSVVHVSNNLYGQRFGVYLDYEAGQLSFYQLSDPIRHLHTFTATFTEPLHASFWLNSDDCAAWVKIEN